MTLELSLGDLIVEKYRLERPIGEGAYGAVWKAQQRGLKRTVAIKFLKSQSQDIAADRRFEREAKVLGRLDHPNCVTMYDYGVHEGQQFLVTEYLEGETMHDWLREEREIVEILQVVWQLLDALAHAHALNIVHRDLKPGNVMIGQDLNGQPLVKVLDFGISRMAGEKRGDITKTGELIGTPGFMSPEQLSGMDAIGPPSDLYAVGVIMYRAFERKAPFKGRTPIEAALKHLTHLPPRVTREGVPDALKDLVAKLLQKKPEDRYPTARAVQMVLREIEAGRAPLAEEPSEPETRREPIVPSPLPPDPSSPTPRLAAAPTPRPEPQTPVGPVFAHDGQRPQPPTGPSAGPPLGYRTMPKMPETLREGDDGLTNAKLYGVAAVLLGIIVALVALIYWLSLTPEPDSARIVQSALRANNSLVKGNEERQEAIVDDEADAGTPVGHSKGCGGPAYEEGRQQLTRLDGVYEQSITVYVPAGYDPNTPHPVVMAIHDTLQPPGQLLDQTGFQAYADRDGVVIVLPLDLAPLDAWHSPKTRARAMDEFELASSELCLDLDHVYLYGHGAGGLAVEKLACKMTSVSGLAVSAHRLAKGDEACEHENIPYLLLSPLNDNRDPADGSQGCLGGRGLSLVEHEQVYQRVHGCIGVEKPTFEHRYGECHTWECETPFVSCHVKGGRPLPGALPNIGCEGDAVDFPYGERVWNFFGLEQQTEK